ncbi:4-hydroxythreonine-4-phosphate dehydrogenase PdxA, partial [Neisseria meningitidis]|nr:4-hydroxythreonine-4-phosphate dehydrogenase PdxA [Neisseria meningitidis]
MKQPVFAVTSGEPAGIGPDICLDLAFARLPCRCAVLGDKNLLRARAEALGKSVVLRDFDPESGGAAYGEL